MLKYLALFLAIAVNALAQISLRFAMRKITINKQSDLVSKIFEIAANKYVWAGLILYGIGFSLYLFILSKFEVSYIYPIVTASIFLLLFILSYFLLNELITIKRIIGILIIIAGIFMASR
jgi:multidrug transporter EmrE-like cation transporter